MSVAQEIARKLNSAFNPIFLQVVDRSDLHASRASESHFMITLASDLFLDEPLLKRHRKIYRILEDEIAGGVYALAIHAYTPEEWALAVDTRLTSTPPCKKFQAS